MNENKVVKALVVEDQESFRLAVIDELKFLGFETFSANDGAEAFALAQGTKFDLILSDIRMPNKDGRWFLDELRKIQKCTPPFVFMTGFADLAVYDAFEMGADGFLGKPIDSDKLAATLFKVCSPLETRWFEKPKDIPVHHITRSFSSLNSLAVISQVSLGRGGMFMAGDVTALRVGELVSFDIRFEDGPLRRLEGIGTLVWRRDQIEGELLAGCGISFDYIAPSSLSSWLAYLGVKDMVPVIPKGRLLEH